ncbi:unnamed protein product [Symbiodinium microadriaticum]|nr:unnamed protein product [Symbiodinium microadriaticum]
MAAGTAPPSSRTDKQAVQEFTVNSASTPRDEQQDVPSHAAAETTAAGTAPPSPPFDKQAVQDFTVNSASTPRDEQQTDGARLGQKGKVDPPTKPASSSLVGGETEKPAPPSPGAAETPLEPRSDQHEARDAHQAQQGATRLRSDGQRPASSPGEVEQAAEPVSESELPARLGKTPALTVESLSLAYTRLHARKASPKKRVKERDFAKAAAPPTLSASKKPKLEISMAASRIQAMYRRRRERLLPKPELAKLRSVEQLHAVVRIQAAFRGRRERRALKVVRDARAMRIAATARLRVKVHKLHPHDSSSASASPTRDQAQSFLPAAEAPSSGLSSANAPAATNEIRGACRTWLARRILLSLQQKRVQASVIKIQAGIRMRLAQKLRNEKAKLRVSSIASLRMRAVRIHKLHEGRETAGSSRSRSASPKGFFDSPTKEREPGTEPQVLSAQEDAEADVASRHRAASRIQASQRGRLARRELAKERNERRMDIASIGALRVKVYNLHGRLSTSKKADDGDGSDGSFFGMFADTAGATPPSLSSVTERDAAVRIQACYRGRQGRRLAKQKSVTAVANAAPTALESVRRSLVAAGFAVVGEANAEIGRLLHRASLGLEEAAALGDRAAQRASIALGETLLHMVVDASTPPISPMPGSDAGSNLGSDAGSDAASTIPTKEVLELSRSMEKSCVRLEAWLQKRKHSGNRAEETPALGTGISPLVQRRRQLRELSEETPKSKSRDSDIPCAEEDDIKKLLQDLGSASIRKRAEEQDKKLELLQLAPCFLGKCSKCRSEVGDSDFGSVSSELEFSLWGLCPSCQAELFDVPRGGSSPRGDYVLVGGPGGPFEALSPFHPMPLAYPQPEELWASPYHLFIAQHFLDRRCRELVRKATPTAANLRSLISQDPLRTAVRDDWYLGWAVKAMRHCIFLAMDQHPALGALLVKTGHARIFFMEDRFWGAVLVNSDFVGENLVGKILEEKRMLLRCGMPT